jgi:hypothetical protein
MALRLKNKTASHRKKQLLAVIALLLAVCAFFVAISAWQEWFWFSRPSLVLSVGFPGADASGSGQFAADQRIADDLENRMNRLLSDQGQLVAWYRLAGRTGQPPAEQSTAALALDQVRYGQYLLEQNDKKRFIAWWNGFRSGWRTPEGDFQGSHDLQDHEASRSATDWLRVNLLVARLLAQSCTLWPDQVRLDDLAALSQQIRTDLADGAPTDQVAVVPTAGPVLDPGATPTPKPEITPTQPVEAGIELSVLRLSSIDLFAMQALAQIDEDWIELSDRYLALVLNGYLGDALPLFAWAWQPETGGYLPFQGAQPSIGTEEAILTILHLCEIGHIPQRSISWIRDQLYNQSALYMSYHTGQGVATDSRECIVAYAMVARIARIIQDENLYNSAVNRLLWHQATSQTSAALSAIFRQEEGSIYVWAGDNVWALLALN